ncbi:hypothetical protein J2T14_005208 [Paenibacillus harenae]|nr:hypothetical protein [Paenibacillus harenae]
MTAASTGAGKTGYVFIDSRITADPGITGVALGRPWRGDANVIYVNSYLGEHIAPEGWNNWGNANNEKTARYGEFASYGPGAHPKSRLGWTKQLTLEEAEQYAPSIVLEGNDGWNPTAMVTMADSNRELAQLTVNGTALEGFDSSHTEYEVELDDIGVVPVVAGHAQSDASEVTIIQAEAVPGTAVVQVTAQDGGVRSYTITFAAADNQAPTLQLIVDKPVLKARGHQMETIQVTPQATDEGSGIASVTLLSITSSEPEDGEGDGNTASDIQGAEYGTSDFEFELRAERSGKGDGRIYTITYEAVDFAGNRTTANTTVLVEH